MRERERSCSKAVGAGTEERRGKGIGFHEISLGDNVAAGEGGREDTSLSPSLATVCGGLFSPANERQVQALFKDLRRQKIVKNLLFFLYIQFT